MQARSDAGVFAELGRELYGWLDGDQGQLSAVLERAGRPVVFEVRGPRSPSDLAWAMLRAPFELLARPDGGLLAGEELTGFCVMRRLGAPMPGPGLDGFRLGLAFMASVPRGQRELDFEAEEAAILGAVGENRVDLVVEDTGDPEQLAQRVADLGGMPAVHLSCHGLNNWPVQPGVPGVPVLMMEDDVGGERPVTAGDLARLLRIRPRLLFVSACLTAAGADAPRHLPPGSGQKGEAAPGASRDGLVAHSMATALVTAGMPSVIGWEGSVGDRSATLFAERLYRALADRADLAVAVGDARRALLESEDPLVRADWHLARLWLGPGGGGPVVAGSRRRSLVPATRATKIFLDRKQQVPVAAPEMFVGRRPEMQQALRALRSGQLAGVLLRGQGRLGKSSLAARIADRFPGFAAAVVFGDYGALAILDAVAAAVRSSPAARQLIESRLAEVRDRPEAIAAVLIDLLAGPCAQAGENKRPLLLIIDDLEQILTADPAGPHRVAAGHAGVLAAVLRAFDPAETDSRLLVTSRYAFTLDGLETRLEDVQLRPLSEVGQRKLQRRHQALAPPERQAERAGLAGRALAVSRGNPGLQDLIGLRVVYGEHVGLQRAEAAVAGMENYLQQGGLPGDAEVRAFLENLALDTLLQEAGPASVALLRAATLFTVAVPEPVIEVLAGQVGGSARRLRGLGLLDPYPDLHDPAHLAMAASPLAAGRLDSLSTAEQAVLAAASTRPLFEAWGGGAAPRPPRDMALDLQLATLALLADDPDVLAVCAAGAVAGLRGGPASEALRLGQDAIALLDRHDHPVPLVLLRQAADAALTSGDGDTGTAMLNRAVQQAEAGGEQAGDPLDRARVIAEQARHLITRGEPQQAEQLLQDAHQLFTAGASESEAAVAMGQIADITYRRGDYDEALRIRREVELPVYERLGDTRSAVITWGKIADIAYRRGEHDDAADLWLKQLEACRRLGDIHGIASANWGLAKTDLARKDYQSALPRLDDSFEILCRLQRPDGIATIGWNLGCLLMATSQAEPARQVLGAARTAATTIGWSDMAQQITDILNQPPAAQEAT